MKKLINNLKISHALIFMTVLTAIVILGISYKSVSNLGQARDYINEIKNDHINPLILLYDAINEYDINIVRVANKIDRRKISWEEGLNQIQEARKDLSNIQTQYKAKITDSEHNDQIATLNSLSKKADVIFDRLEQIIASKDDAGLKNILSTELLPVIDPITNSLRLLIKEQEKQILEIDIESESLYNSVYVQTRNFGITSVFIIIILAFFLIGTITRSLKNANESIKRISEGDLTVKIVGFGRDEIGQLMYSIKGLVRNLRSIIEIINSAANNIGITSHELSTNSQHISQGATEQAASVEQMAASMEEISSNIIQNAKNAQITEQISTQAGTEFENGRGNIDTTVDAIQTIASKISIIGEIAFQTNILALNAAVEAARAGEHGKGFGVVAAEVGKLADRSKIAAAEIDTISKSGLELSLKSKELLKVALPSINKTVSLVKEISLASSEQSSGVDQINTGIQTLNHVTQQNAAASEEMATVAEELSAQAEQLVNSVSYFNIGNKTKIPQKKKQAPKYIEQETKIRQNQDQKSKGIDLDMSNNDNLDSEFETF